MALLVPLVGLRLIAVAFSGRGDRSATLAHAELGGASRVPRSCGIVARAVLNRFATMNDPSIREHDVWLEKISSALRNLRKSGWNGVTTSSKDAETSPGTRGHHDPAFPAGK